MECMDTGIDDLGQQFGFTEIFFIYDGYYDHCHTDLCQDHQTLVVPTH